MTDHPERIYNWLDSQLSIARFAGSISINGATYVVAMHEEGQPLVRQDVSAAEAKAKAKAQKAAKAEREKWTKAQQSFAEFSNAGSNGPSDSEGPR